MRALLGLICLVAVFAVALPAAEAQLHPEHKNVDRRPNFDPPLSGRRPNFDPPLSSRLPDTEKDLVDTRVRIPLAHSRILPDFHTNLVERRIVPRTFLSARRPDLEFDLMAHRCCHENLVDRRVYLVVNLSLQFPTPYPGL